MPRAWCLVAVLLLVSPASAYVMKHALDGGRAGRQVVGNGGLEQVAGGLAAGWRGWEQGYALDGAVAHAGRQSARCENRSAKERRGIWREVALNQRRPAPIIATGWSKAAGVSGSADGDYSLYLDLEFTDGTPSWGHIASFQTGTHDWQKRTVTILPGKPVKVVRMHALLRNHTGTAWFDDLALATVELPAGAAQFDGVPVAAPAAGRPTAGPVLKTVDPVVLRFDGRRGELGLEHPAGVFVRDAAARSDFIQPAGRLVRKPDGSLERRGVDTTLGLELTASYRLVDNTIRINGRVRDLRGRDRAVTVYFTYPVEARGWQWHDDMRSSRRIEGGSYQNVTNVGAGANGAASRYPLACISGPRDGLTLATPLDQPRLCRLGYDADSRELYAAFDLGLSPATSPAGQATFSLVLYRTNPQWGFRAALQRYYDLFPQCFTKRNQREGIWMPFTDISTVQGWEDFGFAFKEGNDNVAFDEGAGVYSFVYVEPVSLWVNMPAGMPRTVEQARAYIEELAGQGRADARAGYSSAVYDPDGEWVGGIITCPWCDGAIYHLNPSPLVPGKGGVTQFDRHWGVIEGAFAATAGSDAAWRSYGGGYQVVSDEHREGTGSLAMARRGVEPGCGASQTVVLNQAAPRPLLARVWTKAAGVTGEADKDYSLYIDLLYADGSPGFAALVLPAATGTHDWQLLEGTVTPAKPIRSLTLHLLLRPPHEGRAWFDDAYLGYPDESRNYLENGAAEPGGRRVELDGVYFDSFEMGSRLLNYRREHFADGAGLVFDAAGRVCVLEQLSSIEFAREVAKRMHARGKLTFANGTPWDFPWGAAWLDVMGTETNWAPEGKYLPNDDAIMNYRRALCYQRPYLLLLNTVYDRFPYEWVERYMQRCTFYGVFPSFFSHDAANDPYWQRPALYNRDRPLFRRYIPVIQRLSQVGWQPVTYARSDNPRVYVERYGPAGGPLYLTLFNDSDRPQRATISLDMARLKPRAGGLQATEVLSGATLTAPVKAGEARVTVEVGGEEVRVYAVR